MQFPTAFTEEEEILKQTLAKLKKKKKQLQHLKSAALSQEKETSLNKTANKPVPAPSIDSADKATEQAKKLVQSGAIKVQSQKEKFGFKRSKNFEKKKDNEKPAGPVGFQPFMAFTGDEEEEKAPPSKRVKGLNESFVSAGFGNRSYDRPERDHRDPPKKGPTVYIHGEGITEDMLKKSFSNFGEILNINIEPEKNSAFVTFHSVDMAQQAIAGLNGSKLNNGLLRVEMARRQPVFDATPEDSSSSKWASIAANNSQKGTPLKDNRSVVTYDENEMF